MLLPPLVTQVVQEISPKGERAIGPVAETATVPEASGITILLPDTVGVAKERVLVTPVFVSVRLVSEPCNTSAKPVEPTVSELAVGVIETGVAPVREIVVSAISILLNV